MAWMRTKIEVDDDLGPLQRRAVAQEIIDFIVERSKNGRDKDGRPFPGYSKSYKESKEFEIAGKSSKVNLTLSGEMLNSIKLLSHRRGELLIGFENGTEQNAKAEGNITGSYGKPRPVPSKARDFLGISQSRLERIQGRYNLAGPNRERVLERLAVFRELTDGDSEANS